MNKKIEIIADRRVTLVNKIAMQRAELANNLTPLRTPLNYADKGIKAFHFLARHSMLLAGFTALAAYVMPTGWFSKLKSSWLAWRILHEAKRSLLQ